MRYFDGYDGGWAPYRSVAQRRADAAKMLREAARRGRPLAPIVIEGRKIATTFWGKAWCDNIERYRDFAYRLERGRSYVRNGSVVDLAITPGRVKAKVLGTALYDVEIEMDAVTRTAWRTIREDCAGDIGSLVDLLTGKLSESVMARLCAEGKGLFPAPANIRIECSCPDYASMCKHVAATMYGVGARLDHAPELLFTLRKVSAGELVATAAEGVPAARRAPRSARVLADDGALGALFGIDLASSDGREPRRRAPSTARGRATSKPTTSTKSRKRR